MTIYKGEVTHNKGRRSYRRVKARTHPSSNIGNKQRDCGLVATSLCCMDSARCPGAVPYVGLAERDDRYRASAGTLPGFCGRVQLGTASSMPIAAGAGEAVTG